MKKTELASPFADLVGFDTLKDYERDMEKALEIVENSIRDVENLLDNMDDLEALGAYMERWEKTQEMVDNQASKWDEVGDLTNELADTIPGGLDEILDDMAALRKQLQNNIDAFNS